MGKSVKSLIEKMKVATLFLCLVGFATSQALTIQRDGEPMPSPPPIESEDRDDDEDSRPPWETDEPDVDEDYQRDDDELMPSPPPIESDVRGEDDNEDVGPPPIRDPEDRYPGCHYADRYGNNSNTNRYSACAHWAAQGFCQGKYGTWMVQNCRASCCC